MKKIFTLILFLAIGIVGIAQQNFQDVVYLKNGSIIRGTIIEQVPNKSIKIETADRNVFVYQMDEIEKMTKEIVANTSKSNSSSGLSSGYLRIINFGFGFGLGDYGKGTSCLKLEVINGYQFNPYFSLGFGTGLKFYFNKYKSSSLVIPLFADFRAHFIDYIVSPYIDLGIGYTIEATPEFRGLGFMLNPSVGASVKIGKKSAMNFGLGYFMQIANGSNLGTLNIDLGFSF